MYKIKDQNKQKHITKKMAILSVIAALVLSGFAYALYQRSNSVETNQPNEADSSINYSPPTEGERQSGDERKKEIVDEGQSTPTTDEGSTDKKKVDVVITDASQYGDDIEVRSFIANVIQEGMCTITFTKGSQSITKAAPAHPDASTTICTNPPIKRSEFPTSGEWTVVVSYESQTATGKSQEQTITIE